VASTTVGGAGVGVAATTAVPVLGVALVAAGGVAAGVGIALMPLAIAHASVVAKTLGEFGGTLPPGGAPNDNAKRRHHANIHAQGPDVEEDKEPNHSWDQGTPITKVQGHLGIESVKELCTRSQLRNRAEAFRRATTFVDRTLHDAPPPLFRSFYGNNNARVDVEIVTGTAFV
jgi:hypothetical protein